MEEFKEYINQEELNENMDFGKQMEINRDNNLNIERKQDE